MYYSNQTLRHKETNKLVALNPSKDNCSVWNWELGAKDGMTHLIDEDGVTFYDNINNYTHINDWFDRATIFFKGIEQKNPYVDERLKVFLVSDEERERKRISALNEWKDKILAEMKVSDEIRNPFVDGNMCSMFYRFFLEEMNVKYLFKKKAYNKAFEDPNMVPYFKYAHKFWTIDTHLHSLFVIEFNELPQIKSN